MYMNVNNTFILYIYIIYIQLMLNKSLLYVYYTKEIRTNNKYKFKK